MSSTVASPFTFPSSLFSFFSPPSHFETRSSISSFLERSQMAFLLMLAVGCTLTLGGEKRPILRQERSLWTAQWLLHSVRNGHWGSKIPFYIASISVVSSSISSVQFSIIPVSRLRYASSCFMLITITKLINSNLDRLRIFSIWIEVVFFIIVGFSKHLLFIFSVLHEENLIQTDNMTFVQLNDLLFTT